VNAFFEPWLCYAALYHWEPRCELLSCLQTNLCKSEPSTSVNADKCVRNNHVVANCMYVLSCRITSTTSSCLIHTHEPNARTPRQYREYSISAHKQINSTEISERTPGTIPVNDVFCAQSSNHSNCNGNSHQQHSDYKANAIY
jgi:hypothetical protein